MDAKLKHLEFIQGAISRMATNSFLFKGWAITIAAGLSAFGAASSLPVPLAIALTSAVLFWGLDAYYLWLERGFIQLHYDVASKSAAEIDFSMAVDKQHALRRWLKTWLRPHLLFFYGLIAVTDSIAIVFLARAK
jgi:hypothetical protein